MVITDNSYNLFEGTAVQAPAGDRRSTNHFILDSQWPRKYLNWEHLA
jgi:hypothetical protein